MADPLIAWFSTKYIWFAGAGVMVKTVADFKDGECSLLVLIGSLAVNAIVAFFTMIIIVEAMREVYPDIPYAIAPAVIVGCIVSISFLMAVARIKLDPIIQKRFEKWGK